MKNLFLPFLIVAFICASMTLAQPKKTAKASTGTPAKKDTNAVVAKHRITFIELGSVNCVPCKAMQPVMKSVEEKYGGQVKVVFYDVWKRDQSHYAQDYKIRLIPTQVFLDDTGSEILRHEGFFPEKEIDAFLASRGVRAKTSAKE